MRFAYSPYVLDFRQPAGTSRGVMTRKMTCIVKIFDENDPSHFGLGEAALFEGLSPETGRGYEVKLLELVANVALGRKTDLSRYPSILYGFEQAIRDFSGGCRRIYFPSDFAEGKDSIEINGLVWMGDFDKMTERIDDKIADGFKCIKLKIGAIEWKKEEDMIRHIRNRFSSDEITIRVDANGGIPIDCALPRLKFLADMGIHSIEQPIPAGNTELMRFLCDVSPVPIALDEELIGKFTTEQKTDMLEAVRPAYIILKPALCGGFSGTEEWIRLAEERDTGWWITSALESNIGLNALAQFTASLKTSIPQGLGTGNLYNNNFDSAVRLDGDRLRIDPDKTVDESKLESLTWRQ